MNSILNQLITNFNRVSLSLSSIGALQIYLLIGMLILLVVWGVHFYWLIRHGLFKGVKSGITVILEWKRKWWGKKESFVKESRKEKENEVSSLQVWNSNNGQSQVISKAKPVEGVVERRYFQHRWKLSLIAGAMVVASLASLLIPAPEVIVPRPPLYDPLKLNAKNPLIIEFDRPINLNKLKISLSPGVAGQWVFENKKYALPYLKEGISRAMIDIAKFYPTEKLVANSEYVVSIEGIQNWLRLVPEEDYLFIFETPPNPEQANLNDSKENYLSNKQNVNFQVGPVYPKELIPLSVAPANESKNVSVTSDIQLRFNQPMEMSSAEKAFLLKKSSDASNVSLSGKFSWVSNNDGHSADTLIFTPQIKLDYDTNYQIVMNSGIKSINGIFSNQTYIFSFKTVPKIFTLDIPLRKQKHTFTCFASASEMVLAYYGIEMTEEEIWNQIAKDPTKRSYVRNIWGDPNKGIVGQMDGSVGSGYGAHWDPVAKMLARYRPVEVKRNWNLKELLDEVKAGNPVMVWWVNGVWPAKYLYWNNADGEKVRAVNGLHVEIVKGWIGDQSNPDYILTSDPWRGERKYNQETFYNLWKWFDETAVVVR